MVGNEVTHAMLPIAQLYVMAHRSGRWYTLAVGEDLRMEYVAELVA